MSLVPWDRASVWWGIDPETFDLSAFGDWSVQPAVSRYLALQRGAGWEHLGYGTFGLNLSKGLKAIGVSVAETTCPEDYMDVPKGYQTVVRASVPNHTAGCWEGQYVVAYTMWEADHLPPAFIENLHNFDMVIVPNDQNRDLFSEHHDNVRKVPLGYDSTIWNKIPRDPPGETFNFLWCGAGIGEKARKGSDLAIRAFGLAFPNWQNMSPQPRLLMKCLLGAAPALEDFCELHAGQWPLEQLRTLYGRAHAMVLPSRGEGWGYHPQQAVATGIPAILSEIPGHTEYSWLPGFLTVPTVPSKALSFIQGDPGLWWEPDLDALIEAYRSVYTDYDKWLLEAAAGAEGLITQYNHRAMAQNLCKVLTNDRLVMTETGPWQEFTLKKYLCESTRYLGPGDCSIGGTPYIWHPGQPQQVPANVRQVLDEAGYLVPGLSEAGTIGSCPHRPEVVG